MANDRFRKMKLRPEEKSRVSQDESLLRKKAKRPGRNHRLPDAES